MVDKTINFYETILHCARLLFSSKGKPLLKRKLILGGRLKILTALKDARALGSVKDVDVVVMVDDLTLVDGGSPLPYRAHACS
jgi:hypothetical protein